MFNAVKSESVLMEEQFKSAKTIFERVTYGGKPFLVRDKQVFFHNPEEDEEDEDTALKKALELIGAE